MQNLLNFLIRYNSWLFFAALETVCLILVFTYNPYQERVYITSANRISGELYTGMSQVSEYFYLHSKNEELVKRNNALQEKVLILEQYIKNNEQDTVNHAIFTSLRNDSRQYEFTAARVISNSVTRTNNFMTLNKGSKDGLEIDMGVIDHTGVVGVIGSVSDNYAVVIPILNPKLPLSVKLKKNDYFGTLIWPGGNPCRAELTKLPRHAQFEGGDTIVTSGHSATFPDGILVGTVDDHIKSSDDNFYSINILLSVDFAKLKNVLVIKNKIRSEQKKLEEPYRKEQKQ